jgi:hypothetical protein
MGMMKGWYGMNLTPFVRTCLHEAAHALTAYSMGFRVLELRADAANDGRASAEFPFTLSELPQRYIQSPFATRKALTGILAALLAPSIILDYEPYGPDRTELASWEFVWKRSGCRYFSTPCGPEWPVLLTMARREVATLQADPGWRQTLMHVAGALQRRHVLREHEFLALALGQRARTPAPAPARQPQGRPQSRRQAQLAQARREALIPFCGIQRNSYGYYQATQTTA